MKEEHIKDLIKKYKSGTSSLEEEQILYDNSNNANASIQMISSFVKKNKKETPKNFNNKLWESFEKKTNKTKKLRIGLFSAAASIILIISFYISINSKNEMTPNEKEVLLSEAKSMFEDVSQEQIIHNIIIENELIVVYTKTE